MAVARSETETKPVATAADVAQYFLHRAQQDGDFVSNLKMQKLVYYAYCWTLVKHGRRLFSEPIEAWPSGPVVPSLFRQLSRYGTLPIEEDFIDAASEADLLHRFPADVLDTIEQVYQLYGSKSAFELAVSTQHEKPWLEARRGLSPTDSSDRAISDQDVEEAFSTIIMEELL